MGRHRYECPRCLGTFEKLVRQSWFRCENRSFNDALRYVAEYERLIGPAPTGCLEDRENADRVRREFQQFIGRTFEKKDHVTSFLLGRFDVLFNPVEQRVFVTVRIHADFVNDNLRWSSAECSTFKRDAQQAISQVWDDQATFTLRKAGWTPLVVRPRFQLLFVDSEAEAQVDCEVFKVAQPMASQGMYDISKNLLRGFPETLYGVQKAMLTDLAPQFVRKNPEGFANHNIIAHEFGHMLGLPDEYDDESEGRGWAQRRQLGNVRLTARAKAAPPAAGFGAKTGDLMSHGTQLHARYFVTVWEALCQLTASFVDPEEWVLTLP